MCAPIQETEASKAGKCFVGADGGKLPNLGRKDITGYCITGQRTEMKLQVAEHLKQTLSSVSKLESSGNEVVFDNNGSYIYNYQTNSYTPLRKEHGAYKLDLWVEQKDPCQQLRGKLVTVQENSEVVQKNGEADEECSGFPGFPSHGSKSAH